MRRWLVVLAVGVVALAIAAWRLLGALDEPAEATGAGPTSIGSGSSASPSTSTSGAAKGSNAGVRAVVPAGVVTVRGTVRDSSRRAVGNARVCHRSRFVGVRAMGSARVGATGVTNPDERDCTTTAADGTYSLANVPTTATVIIASAARLAPKPESVVALVDGETRTVDFVLSENAARLAGSVRDLAGAPIEGARVWTEGTFAHTRANGAFELWVERGPVYVAVSARGFASTDRSTLAPATTDFALEPEGTITGTVVDASGTPVSDARVRAGTASTMSAADGTFVLVGLASHSYEVSARAVGAAGEVSPVMVGLGQHVTGVVVRVGEAFQVAITVRHADKTPCSDAVASIYGDEGPIVDGVPDGPGTIVFDGIPRGSHRVSASCGTWSTMETLEVHADAEITLQQRADATGVLRVTVEAPGRIATEADALFLVIKKTNDVVRTVNVPANRVVVENVPAGMYSLRVASISALEGKDEFATVRVGETTDAVIRLDPPTKGSLRVFTVDDAGRSVGNIPVNIVGPGVRERIWTMASGNGGMYFPAGDYEISYRGATARGRVTGGSTTSVQLVLRPTATVTGTVIDTGGQPLSGATVMRVVNEARVAGTTSDGGGAFRIPMFGEPPFMLLAMLRDAESPLRQTDGTEPVKLVIGGGGTINGTVVTADGKPALQFSISLHDETRNISFPRRTFTNGSFTWRNLQVGSYVVFVNAQWTYTSKGVTLASGAASATVALELPRTFTVRGRLVDAVSGAPLTIGTVSVDQSVEAGEGTFLSRTLPTKIDENGRFTISTLSRGAYHLAIEAGSDYLAANRTVSLDRDVDLGDVAVARARK
jgi:hypothetical protein